MKKKSLVMLVVLILICIAAFLYLQKKTIVISADYVYEKVFSEDILDDFHKQNPGIELQITYGNSRDLSQKIENGEIVDLFLSASLAEIDTLKSKGFVSEELITPLWTDNMVLITLKEKPIKFDNIANTTRIAVCHPDRVQSGFDAREMLKEAGLWEDIRNNVTFTTSEPETLNFVIKGNTDAGIVYASTAVLSGDKVLIADSVQEGDSKGALLSAGIVYNSKRSKEALSLINYLKSDAVRQTLSGSGLTPVQ